MQCDPTCSNYHPCISACPPDTCENLMHPLKSERLCNGDVCVEGCKLKECPVGHVYSNGSYSECVPKVSCKPICLQENGVTYFDGDVMASDACHTCKCTRGSKVCSGLPCATDMPDVSFDASKGFLPLIDTFPIIFPIRREKPTSDALPDGRSGLIKTFSMRVVSSQTTSKKMTLSRCRRV